MDPVAVGIFTSFATTLVTKGAEAPARTLDLLWQITLGRWDPKMKVMVQKILGYGDVIDIPGVIDSDFRDNAVSINNLARLGLVEIDHVRSLDDPSAYEPYKLLPEYIAGLAVKQAHSDLYGKLEVNPGMFMMTPFGRLFREICL